MNQERVKAQRLRNLFTSALLVFAMAGVLALVGFVVAGPVALVMFAMMVVAYFLMSAFFSWRFELWLVGARKISRDEAPGLAHAVDVLSRRAGLETPPALAVIPAAVPQAFSVGTGPRNAVIGLTMGLLLRLSSEEIVAILAHETSHIRHRDMRLMSLTDSMNRLTNGLVFFGWLLLMLNLPLILLGERTIPWLAIGILIVAPNAVLLLQLALSRAREYDADAGAVELTGDPGALAAALTKIEYTHRSLWHRLLRPGLNGSEPSLLRTHPATEQRIERLRAMEASDRKGQEAELFSFLGPQLHGLSPLDGPRLPPWSRNRPPAGS